jgi:drug/metabolite transporter (DMT)-like permease
VDHLFIWVALLSAGTLGLVTVLDKRLASYSMPSLGAFYAGSCIPLLVIGGGVLAIDGLPAGSDMVRVLTAALSGLLWGGALSMMFWGYKLEEASRASAIIHTFPVFVAILGVVFLGETLSAGQWAAIVTVVAGASTISLWGSGGGMFIRLNRSLPILLGASALTALGLVTSKYALEELPVGLVFGLRNLGMGLVMVSLTRPRDFRMLGTAVRDWRTALTLFLAEYSLAPLAVVLNVTAISLGPVSLVATVTATRPIFVFIYSTLFSTAAIGLLHEPLDRSTLAVKLAAIVMVVGGIAALTLL